MLWKNWTLVVPARPKLALVARVIADSAVFDLPDPVVGNRSNQHVQVRLAWNCVVDINSHELVTNQLVSRELRQASAVDLMKQIEHSCSEVINVVSGVANKQTNNAHYFWQPKVG